MDYHIEIPLDSPVTIRTPLNPLRRGNLTPSGPVTDKVFSVLQCWLTVNITTRQIWAAIAGIGRPLMVWGPQDFDAVAADLPEHHAERVLQLLGSDPATTLQALCDGTAMPPAPPRVPREIANWRARAVLEMAGLMPSVEAAIAALPEPDRTVAALAWAGDAKLARHGKTVTTLATHLGLDADQLDQLFIAADALEV